MDRQWTTNNIDRYLSNFMYYFVFLQLLPLHVNFHPLNHVSALLLALLVKENVTNILVLSSNVLMRKQNG